MKIQCAVCDHTGEIPDEEFNKMREHAMSEAKSEGGEISGRFKAICHGCMTNIMAEQAKESLNTLNRILEAAKNRSIQPKTPENKPVLH